MNAATDQTAAPHIPVLLDEVRAALAPVEGAVILDGTFGAGGYSRALLADGAAQIIGVDRDPGALSAADWALDEPRLTLVAGVFGDLDVITRDHAKAPLDGVVLDIGVSSMQLDQAGRGFSFLRDGPLDMRMSGEGPSAADLVNETDEATLASILFHFGEERASRRIAKAIVRARTEGEIASTLHLAGIIADVMPAQRPGQIHPATRSFQGLRIAVNDELGELVRALGAAERALTPGGRLVIVTFHSLEDRIAKRYLQAASASRGGGSRYGPEAQVPPARYQRPRKDRTATEQELSRNPRARSARLRSAVRTEAPAIVPDPLALGLPEAPVAHDLFRRTHR